MKILVIIVTYNGMKWIERCFGSVKDYDVFVVDNGSTDGTQEYIRTHFPKIIFYQSESNLGFGKANNIGMRYAIEKGYDYVYLMNQDAWVTSETIDSLIKTNIAHPEYGILSPMQMKKDMRQLDSIFGRKACSWETNSRLIEDMFNNSVGDVYQVAFVMAAHWLISIECLRKVGLFSPTFPHYGEDDNYIDRAKFHGFNTGIVCKAKAVHDRSDLYQWSAKKQMYIYNYIKPIKKLSDINADGNPWPVILKNAITYPMLYRSLKPIGYLFRIMWEYHAIKRNREKSKHERAFM